MNVHTAHTVGDPGPQGNRGNQLHSNAERDTIIIMLL